jgi:hypothetical protein
MHMDYPATQYNYNKLKTIVMNQGIQLVCVQYPMRNILPLKKVLELNDGIFFVDNEKIFKDAVAHESYEAYFVDNFAGDFGHCTDKGNQLLVKNSARTILKAYFNK